MEWTLKIDTNLRPVVAKFSLFSVVEDAIPGPWILHEGWCDEGAKEALAEDNSEWGFDDGVILETTYKVEYLDGGIYFLDFIHTSKSACAMRVSTDSTERCYMSISNGCSPILHKHHSQINTYDSYSTYYKRYKKQLNHMYFEPVQIIIYICKSHNL
jgi:hypothetical protein